MFSCSICDNLSVIPEDSECVDGLYLKLNHPAFCEMCNWVDIDKDDLFRECWLLQVELDVFKLS